jgi:hypothetical protein
MEAIGATFPVGAAAISAIANVRPEARIAEKTADGTMTRREPLGRGAARMGSAASSARRDSVLVGSMMWLLRGRAAAVASISQRQVYWTRLKWS